MRERAWAAANVQLDEVTVDTDTTVHTLFGKQMGGRKGYNPKNRGKKSYQPILSFIAETREYAAGALHNGDRLSGKEIADHLKDVAKGLPPGVKRVYARADSGFYCWQTVEAYEKMKWQFIVVARKTARLVEELKAAQWKRSPRTDADGQCEFFYQPEGWGKAFRLLALRYEKTSESRNSDKAEQYQLFDTPEYTYRVFVTDMDGALDTLVWFYNQRAAAENLIKEANNDAGLTAHPSNRWMMNANWFQIAMLAYNLNCWLQLYYSGATVQPRGERFCRCHQAHHAGHGTPALPVPRRPNLAPRRQGGRQLQRPLSRERRVSTTHEPSAQSRSRAGWICSRRLCAATCLIRQGASRIDFYAHGG
jgi:hypothetical protein